MAASAAHSSAAAPSSRTFLDFAMTGIAHADADAAVSAVVLVVVVFVGEI